MKKYFYIFNYLEWAGLIIICLLYRHLLSLSDDGFVKAAQTFIFVMLFLFLIAVRSERELYKYNAYKYRCIYKVNQLTVNDKIYYVPIVEIYTYVGSRYVRIIDNTDYYHLTDTTFNGLKERIKDTGYTIPSDLSICCHKTEEEAYYEMVQCKQYIDGEKRKYSGKIKSKEVNVKFKK